MAKQVYHKIIHLRKIWHIGVFRIAVYEYKIKF